MAKVYLQTYGCQANKFDSETMAGLLLAEGNKLVDNINEADTIVVNTCSVKIKTQNKELSFIDSLPKDKQIVVGGCLTKTIDIRKYVSKVDAIFDTNSITKINEIINENKDNINYDHETKLNLPKARINKDIGIILCQAGGLNRCSFCRTRLSRGILKS